MQSSFQMIKRVISLIFLLNCLFFRLHGNESYSEYWQQCFWNMWENESFAIRTYIKIDTGNHIKNVRSMQFNEQFIWKATENLFLEMHYTYIHGRSIVPKSPWRWQYRLELEANPTFNVFGDCLIITRNRLEIRRVQTEPKTLYRLRQRTMLVIPLKNHAALKSFSIYNELYYNISTHRFSQDRICPCQFTFALKDKLELNVFFLIRFLEHNDVWHKSAVLGTQLNF